MKKFCKKILLFFVLVGFVDVASGYFFQYLRKHAKGGETHKNYYISEDCCDDILILGSSRAARHYVPKILEDSLNLSCFNCAEPGCGIITAYARYQMIAERHKPKLVIYEVTPLFDYFVSDDYSKYLGRVRQYADKKPVKELFINLRDNLESFRLLSNMYINNSFIVHNILDNLVKATDDNGFKPLHGVLKENVVQEKVTIKKNQIDSLKLSYVDKFISELKRDSVSLCLIVSPRCIDKDAAELYKLEYIPITDLSMKYDIPFIDHTYMDSISDNRLLFQDFGHMNQNGAMKYTKAICSELRKMIKR